MRRVRNCIGMRLGEFSCLCFADQWEGETGSVSGEDGADRALRYGVSSSDETLWACSRSPRVQRRSRSGGERSQHSVQPRKRLSAALTHVELFDLGFSRIELEHGRRLDTGRHRDLLLVANVDAVKLDLLPPLVLGELLPLGRDRFAVRAT